MPISGSRTSGIAGATRKQAAYLRALLKERELTDADLAISHQLDHYEAGDVTALNKAVASEAIGRLLKQPKKGNA
jgi:hypothetical protein